MSDPVSVIVVDGFGVLCGTCGAPFAHPDAVQFCPHDRSVIPLIPEGAPLPTSIGPRYQAGPRTYRAAPDRTAVRLWLSKAAVWLGLLLMLGAFAVVAWRAFDRSSPAPGCGRACVPAITYTTGTADEEQERGH
jgi:hypothetical protein